MSKTILIPFSLLLADCGGPAFFHQQKETSASDSSTTFTSEKSDASKDASVVLPEGLLGDGESISLEEGADVSSSDFSDALQIDGDITVAGPSIHLDASNVSDEKIQQMTLEIPVTASGNLIGNFSATFVVIYHTRSEAGEYYFGLIPFKNLDFGANKVRFKAVGMGNYQAVILPIVIDEGKSVKTSAPSKTKVEEQQEKETESSPGSTPGSTSTTNLNVAPTIAAIPNQSHSLDIDYS